jgi:hypothetical protein
MYPNLLKFLDVFFGDWIDVIEFLLMQFYELVPRLFAINGYPLIIEHFTLLEVYPCELALANAGVLALDDFDVLDAFKELLDDVVLYLIREDLRMIPYFLNQRGLLDVRANTNHVQTVSVLQLLVLSLLKLKEFVQLKLELEGERLEICNDKHTVCQKGQLSRLFLILLLSY